MAANNGMKDFCGKRITQQALPQTTHGQNRVAQQTRERESKGRKRRTPRTRKHSTTAGKSGRCAGRPEQRGDTCSPGSHGSGQDCAGNMCRQEIQNVKIHKKAL